VRLDDNTKLTGWQPPIYKIPKEVGYKVRFLNANIKIDKDGKYEISKE
jgi:hypothetical protein